MTESIEYINKFNILGLDNHYFTVLLMMLLDWVIVLTLFAIGSAKPTLKPKKTQNLMEWAVKFLTDYADDIIGPEAPKYYGLIVTLFFYILIGNLMGLIPGLVSPTANLSVTVALALIVFVYEWVVGLIKKGPVKFFAHYMGGPDIPGPIKPVLFIVEFLSDISRPVSLSFRLFGNIMAKEMLLGVLVMLVLLFWPTVFKDAISATLFGVAGILRPLILWLGTLISVIQASVFTLLAATYIAGSVQAHDEREEHEKAHA
ncbi:MAG: F0F1 ATP synthase subunit A [Spirochaetia bacterium]|nr:F0F1 ATP synthase subunit A [Spirochaetia bacterium]